jgi:hypothetical protein
VLLSNQRHQNEKLGIDEFDEFPLLVPPLDDDPFASLSTADLAAMEAAPDGDEEASGSEYQEDEDDVSRQHLWCDCKNLIILLWLV